MLVLGRKIDQRVVIDNRIEVVVTKINGGMVRLGIEAPSSVSVVRKELYQQPRQRVDEIELVFDSMTIGDPHWDRMDDSYKKRCKTRIIAAIKNDMEQEISDAIDCYED